MQSCEHIGMSNNQHLCWHGIRCYIDSHVMRATWIIYPRWILTGLHSIDQRPRNQDNTNFPSHRSSCGTAISIVFLLYRPCVRWHRCAHGVISTVVVSWMDINHSNGGFARVKHDVQSDHIIYPRWLKEVRSWLCATR